MKLGIDAGAYSVKIVVLNDNNELILKKEKAHHNKVKDVAVSLLEDISFDQDVKVAVTGSMSHLLNLDKDSFIKGELALIQGQKLLAPNSKSLVYIGAQKTFYIETGENGTSDIRKNSNCSAGTGAFFEEQSTRLQIPLENISDALKQSTSVPQIAGRCSVFSKTDMIHKMQEGVSTPDILMGLCFALVRNYKSNILHNQGVSTPVLLAGGVTKNDGVVTALKDLLELKENDYILDDNSAFVGAYGSACLAKTSITKDILLQKIKEETLSVNTSNLKPLYDFMDSTDSPEFKTVDLIPDEETFLGIDIGSTSINLVLLNKKREVIYYSYVRTLGRPLDIVKAEIEKLRIKYPELKAPKICVTGSGREYVGKEINADLVINEITAQTEGALMNHPETDTIFEIGGQDSKYMSARNGKMTDFEMNKVCAAGTGAFLEEQIKKLGISMEQFIELALKANHPCQLGNRCTVFIEGSINRALAEGNPMEDVCAGLAYAIATNYLHRVVNQKKIGENIAVQGGIAYNEAVLCAFRAVTNKKLHVSPYFSVTGAMGAASLLINRHELVFDKEKNQRLNAKLMQASEESYLRNYQVNKAGSNGKKVGVPRVVFLHKMFPLFSTLFSNLGFEVVLSPLTDKEIVNKANQYVTAEVCYPIKLIYGHIAWLLEQHVDYIVLPRLYTIKHEGSVARKDYACMYMQTSPLLMEEAFHLKERGVTLIMPELSLNFGKKFMLKSIISIGKTINVPAPRMIPAAIAGFRNLIAHSKKLEALGKESLEGDEPIFVLISRVYNIIDPTLNMGIEKHLNDMGCRVVHLEHLEASYMNVAHDYKDMYWPFGQHILTGLKLIKANKNFYPIYITNHGCGPDTAIQHFFQTEMKAREYLQLEVDEHASPVGIITRLEAFLYSLQEQKEMSLEEQDKLNVEKQKENQKAGEKILIPNFGIYTDIIQKYLQAENKEIVKAKPLEKHQPINYAMNKEYYSMLVSLEELLNAVEKGTSYELYFPQDEGSEVFGQFGLLCQKELQARGYDIKLRNFYLEDLIKRNDINVIFKDMLDAEIKSCTNSKNMILGEPLCLLKPEVNKLQGNKMPFSEALLFHFITVDRKHEYTKTINVLKQLHDEALGKTNDSDLYTDMDKLFIAAKNKLDFCIGDSAKYRFAKLLCLDAKKTDAAFMVNSAEENSAIILKQLLQANKKYIQVPYKQFDVDFEHGIEE